jgi:hypothetical protein
VPTEPRPDEPADAIYRLGGDTPALEPSDFIHALTAAECAPLIAKRIG